MVSLLLVYFFIYQRRSRRWAEIYKNNKNSVVFPCKLAFGHNPLAKKKFHRLILPQELAR